MPVVVLFKSEGGGPDKFVKALDDADFTAISVNCLDFHFKNLEELKERLEGPDNYEGIIFTSQRAVEGTGKAVEHNPAIMNDWIAKSNFCVGESTSESSKSLLKLEPNGKLTGNAQNLAALIVEQYKGTDRPNPFLFPSGNLKQDILEKSLSEHKIEVEAFELYETIAHEKLDDSIADLKDEIIDYLVFFSPSGVKFSHPLLVKHGIDLNNIKIVAIGPSTKKSLDELSINCHRVCAKPSPESLLEALA